MLQTENYPEGTILKTTPIYGDKDIERPAIVETKNNLMGVTINGHWFSWDVFFAVNKLNVKLDNDLP